MKIKFLVICLFLVSNSILAQVGNENVSFSTGNFFLKGNRPTTKEYVVDGNPYIDGAEFHNVKIDGYSKNVQDLRYNAYEDEMEFIKNDVIYYANKEEGLKIYFIELKKTYQCLNYSYDNKNRFGYLVLLVENPKLSLYKREKIELLKGEKSPNAYSKDANDYYAKEKDLYIVKKEDKFFKLSKNIKDFITDFSLEKNEVSDFYKKNKLNFSKEEDLIKLFNFINNKN